MSRVLMSVINPRLFRVQSAERRLIQGLGVSRVSTMPVT